MWRLKSKQRNKFNARTTIYGGLKYDSMKEAQYAQELDLRVKAHDIRSWERQKTIDLKVNGKHICNYRIDFVVLHNDGTFEYIEIKGFATREWQLKWKIFEALYGDKPNIVLTVQRV